MYGGKGRASLEPRSEDVTEALDSKSPVLGDRLGWPEQGATVPVTPEGARMS